MSNFSRKQRKNKKSNSGAKVANTNSLSKTYQEYVLDLSFSVENIVIEVFEFNSNYYQNGNDFINSYGLLISDYKEFLEKIGKKVRFIDFLKDSVENNPYLSDTIQELDFEVEKDHILFNYNGEKLDYINMGEFYIDNFKVNVCHSYTFIEDLLSDTKYMYYGD